MRKTMAYVPSSDVPSAFLISSDADAVLLDLLGTFILLDGGAEKVLFTKHVRQIDANVISAPTRAALTNAVELNPNKDSVVPLVGNIPTVKSAGADGSVASLLKRIEQNSEGRPLITNTRFNPKFEPIVISKSLRTGRLELIVLAGEPKEVEALQRAVENGDEQTIEKVASNNGTISVLVWFPARPSDPIKRILHTGTAPLGRIITALERAKALPFLHSPVVSAANAYKEVAPPPKTSVRNSASSRPVPVPASKTNSAATKPLATKRPSAPNSAQPTPARTLTSTTTKTTSTNARPPLARPNAVTSASNRTRPATATTTTKNGLNNNNKVGAARKPVNEAPIQKTTVAPVKGAAMSRASAAIGKVAGNVAAKAASTLPAGKTAAKLPSKEVSSPKSNATAPAPAPVPTPVPAPDEVKEQAPTPVEPSPPLDDSVVILDDVVPDICVDAPQDPASSDLRPPVDLIVIPPTPEPASQSPRSSVDGPPSPTVSPKTDGDIHSEEQQGPHTPQPVGENGLLDDLEEPPKLMKISMDTDDLKKALEKGATAVADQLAQCLDALSLDNTTNSENHEESKLEKPEDPDDVARKISQQMIEEASTPFASALASALTDGVEAAKKLAGDAYGDLADIATTVSEAVTDGVKEASDQVQEKMKAMQTRSSLIEHDGDNRPVKYEETDPVIDSVLETVASDSDRVDHALSNGGPGYENKENGKKPTNEVDDDDGFRVASDTHNVRLFLPPPSGRGAKATPVPHLSRPLYFELATVPHFNGRCSLPDEQSAVEYFTNIRSANYILHSDDISPAVLDGWLTGKKHWLRNEHKSRLIPTRHHSALMAFVTAHSAELEEHGMAVNSSLEHNTISLNTEEGREDYHMMKIEL